MKSGNEIDHKNPSLNPSTKLLLTLTITFMILSTIAVPNSITFGLRQKSFIPYNELDHIVRFQNKYKEQFGTYYDGNERWLDSRITMMYTSNSYSHFIGPYYFIPASYKKRVLHQTKPNENPINFQELKNILTEMGRQDLFPRGDKDSFISFIVSNIDDDETLDILYVTEKGDRNHLVDDRKE